MTYDPQELLDATAYLAKHDYEEDREKYRAALEVLRKNVPPEPERPKKNPWVYEKPRAVK